MKIYASKRLAVVILLAGLPTGFVMAAGGADAGGAAGSSSGAAAATSLGSTGASVGAAGTGNAAVGGGPPGGQVGGGPPAGLVGGGAPSTLNPAGNGAAGTGNPSLNAVGERTIPTDNPASGTETIPTAGHVVGGTISVPPDAGMGTAAPPIVGQAQPAPVAPDAVKGVAEQPASSTVGLARPGPDGVSTEIVAPRPCSTAAHETDGTTTCIGIPSPTR
jgi:hypothetical protein